MPADAECFFHWEGRLDDFAQLCPPNESQNNIYPIWLIRFPGESEAAKYAVPASMPAG